MIHEHHARRLHWDLRLEHDGALASWALPKGLPEAPGENRFAAATEDHPLEYLDFEGEIPRGQYGAGQMTIWDTGTYECLKWEPRKIEVALHGERVDAPLRAVPDRAAARTRQGLDDPPHGPARGPRARADARADRADARPRRRAARPGSGGWAYEIKWDGVRAIAYCRARRAAAGEPQPQSTSPTTTRSSPELDTRARLAQRDPRRRDRRLRRRTGGRASRRCSSACRSRAPRTGAPPQQATPVTYVIFDLLWLDGHSLIGAALQRPPRAAGGPRS